MHRLARTLTVVSLAGLLAAAALPAQAKSARSEHRDGKKPIGEIVSFDAATSQLVVDLYEGEDLTAAVAEDAQVKLEHRGSHRRSKGHGNPSNGSLEDLAAGALVLRLKIEDEEVTKIRLRPAPAETPAEGDQSQDGTGGEDDAGETDSDESDESDSDESDEDAEDADETDDQNPDEDLGDTEETLPSLPVPQP